jgi:predicted DNA-binding transcriptional regulator YafY
LAERFKISKRQVYNLIEELKLMGPGIQYSKRRQTYYYVKGQGLEINFSVTILTENELQKIHGACPGKYLECNVISPYGHTFIPILV